MVNKDMSGMIKLKGKGDEYSDEVRSRLKGSGSDRRKFAQKLSSIPYMKQETLEKELMQLVIDPQASAIQIRQIIQKVLDREDLNATQQIALIRALNDTHKTIFGDKQLLSLKVEKTTVDEVTEILREYQKGNEKGENETYNQS